ncbi:MAG TPA: glycosyltransferase [Sporichthyaceae bacterium]|nr:glycosyltransferase [Sporichthyaceae bacterium]
MARGGFPERLRRRLARPSADRAIPAPADITLVLQTTSGHRRTAVAVEHIQATLADCPLSVAIVVIDNGCGTRTAEALDLLPKRFPGLSVVHIPNRVSAARADNRAATAARSDAVIFLDGRCEVRTDWLAPLVAALLDPTVAAAQSLLLHPDETVCSAGLAVTAGGMTHRVLAGFPPEDATGLDRADLPALTRGALAVRRADLVALGGFDEQRPDVDADIDFCARLRRARPGRLAVVPQSRVIVPEPPPDPAGTFTPGGDDLGALCRAVGFPDGQWRRPLVTQHPPCLRWAIKTAATSGSWGDRWGDTHFAGLLAEALRAAGQHVSIDRRDAHDRATGAHDEVVLCLRGLTAYQPKVGQLNLLWLISHPELFGREEAAAYDGVFAASISWAAQTSHRWGIEVRPLLQATDPSLFHPDRALPDQGDPVLFVGNSRKVLRPMVAAAIAADLPLSVYGAEWDDLIPRQYIRSASLPHELLGSAYRSAGVVLNDHWEDMRATGFVSNRLFDAAACGARVITDGVLGIEGLFGRSVQVAGSAAELARLAGAPDLDAVFGDDAERRAVAARMAAEHSFDVRARQLLDTALRLRAARGLS